MKTIYFILTLIYWVDAFELPNARLEAICPVGVDIILSDSPGIKYVAVQANLNEPIVWSSLGMFSNSSTATDIDGFWKLHLSDVSLNVGDTLNYWLHVIYRQTSVQSPNLSWKVKDDPCSNIVIPNCETSVTRILNNKSPCKGELIFVEEFHNSSFEQWDHDVLSPDDEFQIYVNNRSNSFVKDGFLHIRATLTSDWIGEATLLHGEINLKNLRCTGASNESCYLQAVGGMILSPVLSARLTTRETLNFMFGNIEFRARTPRGLWLWPEILLKPRFNAYGIEKHVSGVISPLSGSQVSVLAVLGDGQLKNNLFNVNNFNPDEFHIYNVIWNPEKLEFSIDGNVMGTFYKGSSGIWKDANISPQVAELYKLYGSQMAPFDQMFYVSLSMSVGGISGNFLDGNSNLKKPWKDDSLSARLDFWEARAEWLSSWQFGGAELLVDYVKIYAI